RTSLETPRKKRVQRSKLPERCIDHRDIGAHTYRHLGRTASGHAAAEDDDVRRRYTWHTAQQHAPSSMDFLQRGRANLHGHSSRHFTHRRQQRQRPVWRADGFIGDRGRAALEQRLCLREIGSEMQVREYRLSLPQHPTLFELRRVHLHDLRGRIEHVLRRPEHFRTRARVDIVVFADPEARAALNEYLVTRFDELADAARHEPDPVLVNFDLFGYANTHRDSRI